MAEKALIHAVSILAKEHVHVALSNHADYSGLLQIGSPTHSPSLLRKKGRVSDQPKLVTRKEERSAHARDPGRADARLVCSGQER